MTIETVDVLRGKSPVDPAAAAASPANVERLHRLYADRPAVLSITGRPATGKSTLAVALLEAFGYPCVVYNRFTLRPTAVAGTLIRWSPRLIEERGDPLPWPRDVAVFRIRCSANEAVRAARVDARLRGGDYAPCSLTWTPPT